MRSFRGLGDLPDRMGLTFEEGSRVANLPYSEGQILATIIDDWRRARVPPTVMTWAARHQFTPLAGNHLAAAFFPKRFPIAIVSWSVDTEPIGGPSTPFFYGRSNGAAFNLAASTTANSALIEGAAQLGALGAPLNPQAVNGPDAPLTVTNAQAGQILSTLHPMIQPNLAGLSPYTTWAMPIYVLPGQIFVMEANAPAVPSAIAVVWRQFPTNVDVLTSAQTPVSET